MTSKKERKVIKHLLLITTITLGSCSTVDWDNLFKSKDETKNRNEKLMKDFEVKEAVLEKFIEEPAPEVTESRPSQNTPSKVNSTKKKLPEIKKAKSNSKRVSKAKVPVKAVKKSSPVKFKYPGDNYPEAYKGMDRVSGKYWNNYKPVLFEGEQAYFSVTYGGISTGSITLETKQSSIIGGHEVYRIHARVKTSKYYSYLYEVNDVCDSYIKKDGFIPLKFSLIQRQSSQDIDDLQLFDHDQLQVYSLYKRVTDEKTKKSKKTKPIPRYFQDPISVVYFIRGLPFENGEQYEIPFMNKGKAEILKASLDKIVDLDTAIGKKKAYKVSITTAHEGKTIKGGQMNFWFTADDHRIFLKFSAKIKIGSIVGEIQKYSR